MHSCLVYGVLVEVNRLNVVLVIEVVVELVVGFVVGMELNILVLVNLFVDFGFVMLLLLVSCQVKRLLMLGSSIILMGLGPVVSGEAMGFLFQNVVDGILSSFRMAGCTVGCKMGGILSMEETSLFVVHFSL